MADRITSQESWVSSPFSQAKNEFEKFYITHLLKERNWNISGASRKSRMFRQNLQQTIRKYGINVEKELSPVFSMAFGFWVIGVDRALYSLSFFIPPESFFEYGCHQIIHGSMVVREKDRRPAAELPVQLLRLQGETSAFRMFFHGLP